MEVKEIADTTLKVVSCCCEPANDCTDVGGSGKGVQVVFRLVPSYVVLNRLVL